MSELRDLYNDVILGHTKKPRNYGPLEDATRDVDRSGDGPGGELVGLADVDEHGNLVEAVGEIIGHDLGDPGAEPGDEVVVPGHDGSSSAILVAAPSTTR